MSDQRDWRDLLGELIAHIPRRKNIAQVLGVHPQTLVRWSTGISQPQMENVETLLHHLPNIIGTQELQQALSRAYPQHVISKDEPENTIQEIPSPFYRRIHHTYASQAIFLRNSSIQLLILQQLLKHLDPHQLGTLATLVQCVPPTSGYPPYVRSLRIILARGTGLWEQSVNGYNIEDLTLFFGAESPCGMAIQDGHQIITSRSTEPGSPSPLHWIEQEQSSVTIPILMGDRIAGGLYVISTQEHYFTPALLDILNGYSEMLTLAFNKEDYYGLPQITLSILPSQEQQQPILATVPRRILDLLRESYKHKLGLTLQQAEQQVWHKIEEELLQVRHQHQHFESGT